MAAKNDIVLIHVEDAPVSFARVEEIKPDMKRGWYVIKLLLLQVPLQVVSWILKGEYIGGEAFFMGGKKMKLEVVECPKDDFGAAIPDAHEKKNEDKKGKIFSEKSADKKKGRNKKIASVISFEEMKKNRR